MKHPILLSLYSLNNSHGGNIIGIFFSHIHDSIKFSICTPSFYNYIIV